MLLHSARTMSASPPAVAYDADEWREHRRCAEPDVDPDWWTEERLHGRGAHECRRHCHVQADCKAEQLRDPQTGVYAGDLWTSSDRHGPIRISKTQPTERTCGSGCAPLAYEPNLCAHCGTDFVPERSYQLYCGQRCYRQAEAVRRRAKRSEAKA